MKRGNTYFCKTCHVLVKYLKNISVYDQNIWTVFVLSVLMKTCLGGDLSFPADFKFGVGSSSYQVEGGWNSSDKSINVWDHFIHNNPKRPFYGDSGDVTCDSYHNWRQDVQLLIDLGVNFYRFSISWPRLLPSGYPNYISKDGKKYYNRLIDHLIANGIEPVVTMYLWDLPQKLQDLGGWANPLITDWFADYANVLFTLYGDRVKIWITLNEPVIFCDAIYNTGLAAPPIMDPDSGSYLCNKHALVAHAKAWRIYDETFKPVYQGKISITNQLFWFTPATKDDTDLTELLQEYSTGRFSHPIYSDKGDWPPTIKETIAVKSKQQGYFKSKLPEFTKSEIKLIKGTYDFYALNYYGGYVVRRARPNERVGPWPMLAAPDMDAVFVIGPESSSSGYTFNPDGLRHQLLWLNKRYGNLNFFITENGYGSYDDTLNDDKRISFYKKHLKQVLLSIKEDGVNVTGYAAWSLMDSFEWINGFRVKYGLYRADFKDPKRKRTPRKSSVYYSKVVRNKSLNVSLKWVNKGNSSSVLNTNNTLCQIKYLLFLNVILLLLSKRL